MTAPMDSAQIKAAAASLIDMEQERLTGWQGPPGAAYNAVSERLQELGLLDRQWELTANGQAVATILKGQTMTQDIEITQADRDAANSTLFPDDHEARWDTDSPEWALRRSMEIGQEDDHHVVQAFARHRLAAEQAAAATITELREENARLRVNLTHSQGRFLNINICLSSGGTKREAIAIADLGEDCIKGYLTYDSASVRLASATPPGSEQ